MDTLNEQLMQCIDIFKLADFLSVQLSSKDKKRGTLSALFTNLYKQVQTYNFYVFADKFKVYDGRDATLIFLDNYWSYSKYVKDNKQSIENIISRINTEYQPNPFQNNDYSYIKPMMELVEKKYNYLSILNQKSKLHILVLDAIHNKWNSFHSATIYENGFVVSRIMLTHPKKNNKIPQEFIFPHELGHVLHTVITKKLQIVPKSFYSVMEIVFHKANDYPENQVIEFFADCFAMSVLYNTEYEKFIPLDYVPRKDLALFEVYMSILINTI